MSLQEQRRCAEIALPMSNLGEQKGWVFKATCRSLYPRERGPVPTFTGGWVVRTPNRRAHSKLLYRQRCSGTSMPTYYLKFYNDCLLLHPSNSLIPIITQFDTLHSQLQTNIFLLSTCESVLTVTRCYTNAPPILRP